MAALAIYAVGFFERPLGGVIVGLFGDVWRITREDGLSRSMLLYLGPLLHPTPAWTVGQK